VGKKEMKKEFRSFEKAREFARESGVTSSKKWWIFVKSNKPANMPTNPRDAYKEEWKGWADFLGTQNKSMIEKSNSFLNYTDAKDKARIYAKKFNLKTRNEWIKACKDGLIPDDIPRAPWYVYTKKRKS
jgi:hypothetical protein